VCWAPLQQYRQLPADGGGIEKRSTMLRAMPGREIAALEATDTVIEGILVTHSQSFGHGLSVRLGPTPAQQTLAPDQIPLNIAGCPGGSGPGHPISHVLKIYSEGRPVPLVVAGA